MSTTKKKNFHHKKIIFATKINFHHKIIISTWTANDKSLTCLDKILHQSLKRALQAPMSTPSSALYMDIGILPARYQIHKKALSYWWKIQNSEDSFLAKKVLRTQWEYYSYSHHWASKTKELATKYKLGDATLMSYAVWKKNVLKAVSTQAALETHNKCLAGSKTLELGTHKTAPRREEYLTKLSMAKASTLFRARCKCLPLKTNHGVTDAECRLCRTGAETQEHLITSCPGTDVLHAKHGPVSPTDLYSEDINTLNRCSQFLVDTLKMIQDTIQN